MRRWVLVVLAVGACGDSVSLADYPDAFRDAYCDYLTRCGAFPDVDTCKKANIGANLHIDPSTQAAIDMGKIAYDGDTAAKCLDEFGSQTCDQTDASGRTLPSSCSNIVHGTVANGGACAMDAECKSGTCDVPGCAMACCQGTCTGDAPMPPGGAGTMCTGSTDCTSGNYCDFGATPQVCTPLKAAGATCQSTTECAYGLGCAGTTTRTCKTLPKLGEACPDGVCRDAGNYCSTTDMTCKKIGLEGASCANGEECSPYYACDTTTMKCSKGPTTGQPCATGQRCFDAGTFCDTTAATPTCVPPRADGGTCSISSQCASDYCDQSGSAAICAEQPICI